jgi:hypothetical protein
MAESASRSLTLINRAATVLAKFARYLKYTVFYGATPSGCCGNRRFGGTYHLYEDDVKISELRRTLQCAAVASYCSRCFYLVDSFHPDDGGYTLLRNVGSYKRHIEEDGIFLSPRRESLKFYIALTG